MYSSSTLFAQFGEGDKSTYLSWKRKTLYVVVYEDSKLYNETVKEVVENRWYNDKIKYIKDEDKEELKNRDNILVLSIKNFFNYPKLPLLCFTTQMKGPLLHQFNYEKDGWAYFMLQSDFTLEKGEYQFHHVLRNTTKERIRLMVDILFNTVDSYQEGEFKIKVPKDNNVYNTSENLEKVRAKTLYVCANNMPRKESKEELLKSDYLKSIYEGQIKVVSEEELAEAIKNKKEDVAVLHIADEISYTIVTIIDVAERKVLYFNKYFSGKEKTIKQYETTIKALNKSLFK